MYQFFTPAVVILILSGYVCMSDILVGKYYNRLYLADVYSNKVLNFIQNTNTIKESPEHTIGLMHINEKIDPPRKNFAFFFKKDMNHMIMHAIKSVTGNNYTFEFPRIGETKFLRWTNEIDCIYTIYRDVYVFGSGAVSDGKNVIFSGNATAPPHFYESRPGPVVKHVMNAVALHENANNFGHFVADCLYLLMALPMSLLKASTILHCKAETFNRELFSWLGLDANVLYIENNDWVHCDSVISATHPMPHVSHFGPLPYRLNIMLREKLNLTSIEPTLYGFVQRSYNYRMVTNINECLAALRARVPNIDWQYFDEKIGSLIESARLHAKLKVFGTVCGSNSHKVIFMSPKSIAVFVNDEMWDYSVYLPPACIGMKIIWFITKHWQHLTNHTVDPDSFAKAFEVAAYYAANEKWPDPSKYNAFIDTFK